MNSLEQFIAANKRQCGGRPMRTLLRCDWEDLTEKEQNRVRDYYEMIDAYGENGEWRI